MSHKRKYLGALVLLPRVYREMNIVTLKPRDIQVFQDII